MTDTRFFGFSNQERDELLKLFQEELIATMTLEQQIESGAITEELLRNSYQRAVDENLFSSERLTFDAYCNNCRSELTSYIALSRALFADAADALPKYGGRLGATVRRGRILGRYQFLIQELRNRAVADAESLEQNVRHILSDRKDR